MGLGSLVKIFGANPAAKDAIRGINHEQNQIHQRIAERQRSLRQEVSVFNRKSNQAFGDTVSSFARAGVDLSGSPLIVMADQQNEFQKTMNNIKRSAESDINMLSAGLAALNNKKRAVRRGRDMAIFEGVAGLVDSAMASSTPKPTKDTSFGVNWDE